MAFFARASQNDGAVVGAHLVSVFLNGAVVPVLRILGILVDGVAKGGQEYIAVIGEQHIVSAGDEADVRASCA